MLISSLGNAGFSSMSQLNAYSLSENRRIGQPGKLIEDLSSKDFTIKAIDKENIKYGLPGDENCDIYYIPQSILSKMHNIYEPIVTLADVAEGRIEDISSIPLNMRGGISSSTCNVVQNAWDEFYKLLNEYGVDHKDPVSFSQFLNNDILKSKFEKELSSRTE